MSDITRTTAASEDKKKKDEQAGLMCCVPDAIAQFKLKEMDASKLTKMELAAVLLVVYGANFLKSLSKENKPFFINKLTDEYITNPDVIDAYGSSSAQSN